MSRYFVNPAWTDRNGRFRSVMEASPDSDDIFLHNLLDGTCALWEHAKDGTNGLARCLRAVNRGAWIELNYDDIAWPNLRELCDLPATTEDHW